MDIYERFRYLRKEILGISQTEFGKRVGVTIGVINNIERKLVAPKDLFIKQVCKEYHVNYLWITEGKGEMYDNSEENLLDELTTEYNLDDLEKKIVQAFLKLEHDKRKVFTDFLKNIFENKNGND
ncbi:MAG: helix-turn-helix transcriptional regulator [Ruminococcus sp.]|nr:helix-turn-helix transcriptional regulator [Ruminococcus sp.]